MQITVESLLARLDVEHSEMKRSMRYLRDELKVVSSRLKTLEKPLAVVRESEQAKPAGVVKSEESVATTEPAEPSDRDSLEKLAFQVFLDTGRASTSLLQVRLSVGYARAARLVTALESRGLIGPADGARSREILATEYPDAA